MAGRYRVHQSIIMGHVVFRRDVGGVTDTEVRVNLTDGSPHRDRSAFLGQLHRPSNSCVCVHEPLQVRRRHIVYLYPHRDEQGIPGENAEKGRETPWREGAPDAGRKTTAARNRARDALWQKDLAAPAFSAPPEGQAAEVVTRVWIFPPPKRQYEGMVNVSHILSPKELQWSASGLSEHRSWRESRSTRPGARTKFAG